MKISPNYLNLLFEYKNGSLFWKQKTSEKHNVIIGSRAGTIEKQGYRVIKISGNSYKEHRLIWIMHGKEIPNGFEIDHINKNKQDNNISNLRLAKRNQNRWNTTKQKNNKTGLKGVSFNSGSGKFQAQIACNKKKIYLGLFNTPEEASKAYEIESKKLHENFSSL